MSKPTLKIVTRLQGNNAALKSGEVVPRSFNADFVEVPVLVQAFRRMVRDLEFDICEMALTTYLCAREHGVRFTAVPVFLVRGFHHGAILHRVDSGIRDPSELEGHSIGVNRGYTVTTGVWARAILQVEYGVDLGKITWMLSGDEHVEAYRPPANVLPIASGTTIEGLLESGELAAAINIKSDDPAVVSMIKDPLEAGFRAYQSRGHYPVNHLVVVRDDVLEQHPDLAADVFDAFAASKALYIDRLRAGTIDGPGEMDLLYARILALGDDPLPYGIAPNRAALEELIGHAMTQGILTRAVEIDSLFAPTTLSMEA